jgi:hypothetical protein
VGGRAFSDWLPRLYRPPTPICLFAGEAPSETALEAAHLSRLDVLLLSQLMSYLSAYSIPTPKMTAVGLWLGSRTQSNVLSDGADVGLRWVCSADSSATGPSRVTRPPSVYHFERLFCMSPRVYEAVIARRVDLSKIDVPTDLSTADISTVSAAISSGRRSGEAHFFCSISIRRTSTNSALVRSTSSSNTSTSTAFSNEVFSSSISSTGRSIYTRSSSRRSSHS